MCHSAVKLIEMLLIVKHVCMNKIFLHPIQKHTGKA